MARDAVIDQVAGIFTRNGVPFATRDDGEKYRVLTGDTAVFVTFPTFGDATVVHLVAPVLEGIDTDREHETYWRSLSYLNDVNREIFYAKFCAYDQALTVECDLFGDTMQAEELMQGLSMVARLANEYDHRLKEELGGKLYSEVAATANQDDTAVET